jgi:hypothetical protein
MLSLLGDKDVAIVADNARSPIQSVTKTSHQMKPGFYTRAVSVDTGLAINRKHCTSRWESMPKEPLCSDSDMSSLCDMTKTGLHPPMRVGCSNGVDKTHHAALSIIMPQRRSSLDCNCMDTAARLGQVLDELDLAVSDDSTSVLSDE